MVSQDFDGSNLVLTRFDSTGKRLSSMKVATADHGDRLEARGDHAELVGLYVGGYPGGTWCRLPWTPGHVWTAAEAKQHRGVRSIVPFGARSWFQGEIASVSINDQEWTLRLYGVPYKPDGPSINPQGKRNPNIPARIEFYTPGNPTVVKTWGLEMLGRDAAGKPIDGRLEPEGLSVGVIQDAPALLVGFSLGGIGDTYMQVYAKSI